MAFSFFSFKKKTVVQDVEPKAVEQVPLPLEPEKSQEKQEQQEEFQNPEVLNEDLASKEPSVISQMSTLKVTREDVIASYKIFLGRLPESMEVVDPRVGASLFALLADFLASNEFLEDPQKSQLVLLVAKKIVDARKDSLQAPTKAASATN